MPSGPKGRGARRGPPMLHSSTPRTRARWAQGVRRRRRRCSAEPRRVVRLARSFGPVPTAATANRPADCRSQQDWQGVRGGAQRGFDGQPSVGARRFDPLEILIRIRDVLSRSCPATVVSSVGVQALIEGGLCRCQRHRRPPRILHSSNAAGSRQLKIDNHPRDSTTTGSTPASSASDLLRRHL
jgi:hypothetical protein